MVVADSVRSVASRLAFSKDTVARALRRLSEAGLVERIVERDNESGRFGRARYCLHLDRAGVAVAAEVTTATNPNGRPSSGSSKPTRPERAAGTQLSLLSLEES